jgi:hypothetical protein
MNEEHDNSRGDREANRETVSGRMRVPVDRLYRTTDPSALSFKTTAELEPLDGIIGQKRALDAIRLGAGIDKAGFNVFAIGRAEAGMDKAVASVLREVAPERRTPSDWGLCEQFHRCPATGRNRTSRGTSTRIQ